MKWSLLCFTLALAASQIYAQNPDCLCPSNSKGAPSCLSADPADTCKNAATVWHWASTVCSSNNPSCNELCSIVRKAARPYKPSLNQLTVFNATYDWGNLYTGAAFSTIVNNGATFGELVYTANVINQDLAQLPPLGQPVFLAWQKQWKELGDRLYTTAEEYKASNQDYSARNNYLRASTAYWLGFIVASRFGLGKQLYESEVLAFNKSLELFDEYDCQRFTVPYTQEGVTFNLKGVHCFPSHIGTYNWLVYVGGLDFPFEFIWSMFAQGALNRGYAVTFFDGPGQDGTLDHSRFTRHFENPTMTVMNYIQKKHSFRLRRAKVAIIGSSLGGYLAGEVCAGMSDKIDACVINPPMWNTPGVGNNLIVGGLFAPFMAAVAAAPHLIPSGFIPYLANANSKIFVPLLTQCGPMGKELVGATLAHAPKVFPPTLLHICERFAPLPHHSENMTYTLSNCGHAFEYLQTFVNDRVANITVPVLALGGSNDDLVYGQEKEFFDQLNPVTKSKSELYFFQPSSGGSMHVQAGAQQVLDEKIYGWLDAQGIRGKDHHSLIRGLANMHAPRPEDY